MPATRTAPEDERGLLLSAEGDSGGHGGVNVAAEPTREAGLSTRYRHVLGDAELDRYADALRDARTEPTAADTMRENRSSAPT